MQDGGIGSRVSGRPEDTQIVVYYAESSTRSKRRAEILGTSAEYFSRCGWESPTMSELAGLLGLERRTLYSYYNNKTDLAVDSFLFAVEEFNLDDRNPTHAFLVSAAHLPMPERLAAILRYHADWLLALYPRNRLIFSYDGFVMNLPPESPARRRFLEVRRRLAPSLNILGEAIADGALRGTIDCGPEGPEHLALVIEQAFRAYVLKVGERRRYTDHYRVENLDSYIAVLVRGLVGPRA